MIFAKALENFKNDFCSCLGDLSKLHEVFGSGQYLSDFSQTWGSAGSLSVVDELYQHPQQGMLVFQWFLQQQNNEQSREACVELFHRFMDQAYDEYLRRDLLKIVIDSQQSAPWFLDVLFHEASYVHHTVARHLHENYQGTEFLTLHVSLFLGECVSLVSNEEARDVLCGYLIRYSQQEALDAWIDHSCPMMATLSWERLRKDFEGELRGWKQRCPNFLARAERNTIWRGIGEQEDPRQDFDPKTPKKM